MAKKKKSSSNSSFGLIVVVALTLGFLAFLFYLASIPPSDGLASLKNEPSKGYQQTAPKTQPPAAKEKPAKQNYEFYQLLEKQTVEVPKVEEYKSTPKDADISYEYLLQVASFRSQNDADSLRASLLLEGLVAYTKSFEGSNGLWYRVYVGPFDNRSKMNQAQDKLAARGLSPLELKQEKKKN